MVLNSTAVHGEHNTSTTQLVVNTSAFNGTDLSDYISLNEDIERMRRSHRRSTGTVTKTREEIFECSAMDDDKFLSALEHQNSYVPEPVGTLDLSQSIEDLMSYFDEDVDVKSGSNTPTPLSAGRVATAVANFRTKTVNLTPSPIDRGSVERGASNIQKLKQRYESDLQVATAKTAAKSCGPPKGRAKSKVKQIAQMFNAKVTQILRRDTDAAGYKTLNNELSPEAKAPPVAKWAPKQRCKPPTYRTGLPGPAPSPRFKRRLQQQSQKASGNACLVAEDVFSQLSVKDKALLYQKFIEDMSKENPKFGKHAKRMEESLRKEHARGEVVHEKQESVERLRHELETKFVFPRHTISHLTLKRPDSMESIPKRHAPPPPSSLATKAELDRCDEDRCEEDQGEEDEALHVSTLTVVLRPSPEAKKHAAQPRAPPRRKRDVGLFPSLEVPEPTQKRHHDAMRSLIPIEAYAPPKKIRRTRAERLAPKTFFQSPLLERLFYSWLKEKNGVSFDIASTDNEQETIDIAPAAGDSRKGDEAVDKLLERAIHKMEKRSPKKSRAPPIPAPRQLSSCATATGAGDAPKGVGDDVPKVVGGDVPKGLGDEANRSAVDKLLEEAITKLETTDSHSKEAFAVEDKEIDTATIYALLDKAQHKSLEIELPLATEDYQSKTRHGSYKKKNRAPPIPAPRELSSVEPPTTASSAKQSENDESESGLSSMPKITSDESQPEQNGKDPDKNSSEFDFQKPTKPPRKKKMKRTLMWKKENSIVEAKTVLTTDSDSDYKSAIAARKPEASTLPKPKKSHHHSKRFFFKNIIRSVTMQPKDTTLVELDKSLMRVVNSPRKIKTAYTLTVMSSPSPHTESDYCDSERARSGTPCRETSRSCPSVMTAVKDQPPGTTNKQDASEGTKQPKVLASATLTDSFIDQGFETGSNEMESPVRVPRREASKTVSPLFIQLNSEVEKAFSTGRLSISPTESSETPSGFSTPVKGHQQPNPTGSRQQLFSPIAAPAKPRRRSFYDSESRRSSLVMEVIREDHPLEASEKEQLPSTPDSLTGSDSVFFANAPSVDMTANSFNDSAPGKKSAFWITAGDDFTVTVNVFHNSPERVRLLYEIFSQKSCETRDLHFGIDDHKFSVHNPIDNEDISKRLPKVKGCSHYWFSTGDLAVPFSGKFMPPAKIKKMFVFIKDCLAETGSLRFGVDNYEFSKVLELWQSTPKFSIESSYNMLVGLQSGTSNGLEGRSKYAWPNSSSSTMMKTSDLDHSEFDSEEFDNNETGRLSFSPFGSNHFDLSSLGSEDLMMARNSDAIMSPDLFSMDYESEPLDKLFEDVKRFESVMRMRKPLTVPEMLETLRKQQSKLKSVEKRLNEYAKPENLSSDAPDQCKDSPEYARKLKNLIAAIDGIGRENGFNACPPAQLESFMYFLSRYADMCLANCSEHMDKILDALMDHRAVQPPENELQKSHDHNPAALSEHQLRIQASLQRLNIPDWFRQYQSTARSPDGAGGGEGGSVYKPGAFTRKRTTESGRWAGLNSKTTSLSSLGSQRSDRSPLLLSPSAHSHHGGQAAAAAAAASAAAAAAHNQHPHAGSTSAYGAGGGSFSRWSTSHLNSSQTSPSVSQRGSFTRGGPVNSSFMSVASGNSGAIRSSFRQPYLGWRSQEKLSQRTPHERLASSLLAQQQLQQRTSPTQRTPSNGCGKLQPVTPEIQSSIKEVTSAIVHYVNDQTNQQRSRSTSPNSRKCWLESSFVGIRPLDSPQTPVIENSTSAFSSPNAPVIPSTAAAAYLNSTPADIFSGGGFGGRSAATGISTTTSAGINAGALRMNGRLSSGFGGGGAPERSLSSASLEDVLASLLGLPSSATGTGASSCDAYARPSTTAVDLASQPALLVNFRPMPQQQQPPHRQQQQQQKPQQQQQLEVNSQNDQRLRRRSEGDAPTQQQKQQKQQLLLQQQQQQQPPVQEQAAQQHATATQQQSATKGGHTTSAAHSGVPESPVGGGGGGGAGGGQLLPSRRVSLGDSSESNNKTTSELQIKCRNTKCERSATPTDAKKYYKSCHNCTHLYCTRECRRAHWEKHRKACLHSRASNLCRQVLATCKDDVDTQRHLSLLARNGFLSQGRGVVRVLFRSAEAAEGFIKHGFQCMGEASFVRWPDLMPAEMGLELYSELLKLSTEYKPDSKMLIYVAICVVSEAPGMGQAPVRWERQLVSRCAKLKLCKAILAELDQQQLALQHQPLAVVAVPEPTTEILILTFNPSLRTLSAQRELVLSNILDILSRRGVLLRKHYPEIYQRLQTYADGQTDKFQPVTLHPRDSLTGQGFVCIIMPVHSDSEIIKLPSIADGGNRVTTIDVGSPAALAQFDDDELLTRSTTAKPATTS